MDSTDKPLESGVKWDAFTAVRWGDQALAWTKRLMSAPRYEALETWVEKAGHYALLVAAALGLTWGIVSAFKSNLLSPFLYGLLWLPVVGVAQFAAFKFSSSARGLIRSSGSQMSSPAFLACLALWSLLLGIVSLAICTFVAIRSDSFSVFGTGVGIFIACELGVWLCLNPALLNIDILPASTAGEEAIGVLAFLLKTPLRLIPVAFGIGVMVGDLGIFAAIIRLFRDREIFILDVGSSAWLVIASAALPLIGYVLFLIGYLALDIVRAILAVPQKLDLIAKK